jgi:hypothetical protein
LAVVVFISLLAFATIGVLPIVNVRRVDRWRRPAFATT